MSDGYILWYRKAEENPALQCERFDELHAWLWLVEHANYKPVTIRFNGGYRTLKRGQMLTSVRKLANKWGWGVQRVTDFLRLLEKNRMIRRKSDTNGTLLTIEKYSVYQDAPNTNENANENTNEYANRTQINKNNKSGGSERSETVRPPQETNVDFYHIPLGEPDELPTIE